MGKLQQESYGARGICGLECEARVDINKDLRD
jgi:hypothetical protein